MPKKDTEKNSAENPFADAHALILAGGSGTRLWPLSRKLLPKQLLALNGEQTLLQQTVSRALSAFDPSRVWIVTNEEQVFEVRSQVKALDPALESQVLDEPMARNTLPAIMLGLASVAGDEGPEGEAGKRTVAVFPSDHMIKDWAGWGKSVGLGLSLAKEGRFVTFGIKPKKAETGYGYIERGKELVAGAYEVKGFTEKPDLEVARKYLESGEYFWNSGMFVFSLETFLAAAAEFTPDIYEWWSGRAETPLAVGYAGLPDVSVDYGIAERIGEQAVVEAGFDWDDLGSWEAVFRLSEKNEAGSAVTGDVLSLDCRDSLLLSEGGKLAAVGLDGLAVIQTRDATLVCPLDEVQRVKDVVTTLKAEGSQLVEAHVTVYRPWGSYTVLEEGPSYKVKRIKVLPGATLSKQMHHHRSEHWVVISGTATVEVDENRRLLTENQSVDIPKGSTHRLENPGKVPLEIIEVQSGPYLEEDDIVRFDDVYGRVAPK